MRITGTLQKAAWIDRTLPPIEKVAEYVWSVPIPFDGAVRHTFCYIVVGEGGSCVVIDPGEASEVGWLRLKDGLEAAAMTESAVAGIVLTHLHRDHIGMAQRLTEVSGAWVALHSADSEGISRFSLGDEAIAFDTRWLLRAGVPPEHIDELAIDDQTVDFMSALAKPEILLTDGDVLPLEGRRLRVVSTPGHTAGHICIVDDDALLVFTGDHVLPRITPNVGLGSLSTTDVALRDYFESLERMNSLDNYEVCPAHEYRFIGMSERVRALREHHEERSNEIIGALTTMDTATTWDLGRRISWARGWDGLTGVNLRSAVGETFAHLKYLAWQGRIILSTVDTNSSAPIMATMGRITS